MRILMLGNSLTSANGLPAQLAELLDAEVVAHTRGGARLAEHLNPATRMGARTQEALAQGGWDFVVLQEMSVGPARSRERFVASAAELCRQVRAAGAVPVLFVTWTFAPGCSRLEKYGWQREELHDLLQAGYREAAAAGDALLADVGSAFMVAGEDAGLYAPDGIHPSAAGSQLAAEVIAGAISGLAGAGTGIRGA